MHTGDNACDCTQGRTDTVKESALEVDSGRKIPCHTGESNLCQWRAGLMLYQMSYIPIFSHDSHGKHVTQVMSVMVNMEISECM